MVHNWYNNRNCNTCGYCNSSYSFAELLGNKMKKAALSFKVIVVVVAFVIILLVAVIFLTLGQDYVQRIGELFWKLIKGEK